MVFTSLNVGINWGGFLDVVTLLYYINVKRRDFFLKTLVEERRLREQAEERMDYEQVYGVTEKYT